MAAFHYLKLRVAYKISLSRESLSTMSMVIPASRRLVEYGNFYVNISAIGRSFNVVRDWRTQAQ